MQEAVQHQANVEVSSLLVRQVMRKDMHLGYRLAKTVPVQCNSTRCLVLRQQFALRMLPLLESGRRVINSQLIAAMQMQYQSGIYHWMHVAHQMLD